MSHVFTPPARRQRSRSPASADTFPVHRIYCVGRNYVEHAKEMGFTGREPPFFFLKPADAVLPVAEGETGRMPYPSLTKSLHHEIELVVAIGTGGRDIKAADAMKHVWGYAVGLDMTRRDLQGEAKKLGRPWDIGKGFDHSAPIGPIHRAAECKVGADTADHARGQRRDPPAEHDRQADLEHRRDHRAPVGRLGARARRPDLHRHARRRGRGRGGRHAEGERRRRRQPAGADRRALNVAPAG